VLSGRNPSCIERVRFQTRYLGVTRCLEFVVSWFDESRRAVSAVGCRSMCEREDCE